MLKIYVAEKLTKLDISLVQFPAAFYPSRGYLIRGIDSIAKQSLVFQGY